MQRLNSHCVDSVAQALAIVRVAESDYGKRAQLLREAGEDPLVYEDIWQGLMDLDNTLCGNFFWIRPSTDPKWYVKPAPEGKHNLTGTSTAARSAVMRRGYIRRDLESKRQELAGKRSHGRQRFLLTSLGEQWVREMCAMNGLRLFFERMHDGSMEYYHS